MQRSDDGVKCPIHGEEYDRGNQQAFKPAALKDWFSSLFHVKPSWCADV